MPAGRVRVERRNEQSFDHAIARRGRPSVTGIDPVASGVTIPELLRRAAQERGHAEAVVLPDARLTYATLAERVARLAGGLARLGIGEGSNVALCMANAPEWLIGWYALTWLGATAVPINTRWKDEEIVWALDHAEARAVLFADTVIKTDFLAVFERIRPRLASVDTFVVVGEQVPDWALRFDDVAGPVAPPRARPDSIGLIQFTSGSTARPKGVMLSHTAMLMSACGGAAAQGVQPGERYFSPRPFFHVAGSVAAPLLSVATQACLVTIPTFDAALALEMLARERCNFTVGNDAMFLMLMNEPNIPQLPDLRGGYAAAGPEVHRLVRDRLGISQLCSSYGLSETCSSPALSRWDDPFEMRAAGWLLPYDRVEIRVRRPGEQRDCRPGETGELFIRGPIVMAGYWRQPKETADAIDAEGWLTTGDLAEAGAGGRFRFVGRLKDIIRVGGENVSPAEVESFLLKHPAIAAAQVVGLPDARLGEVVVAYVMLRPGSDASEDELAAWSRATMANFKAPRRIGRVASFDDVMTGSGKPRKDLLRARAAAEFASPRGN
jgi:fatty-acyl-CoA synthase